MSHLIIKVCATLEVLLRALNEQQNVWKSAYCILITPHHHVCKSDIVARSNMTCGYLRVHWLQCKTKCNMFITTDVNTKPSMHTFHLRHISVKCFTGHWMQTGRFLFSGCGYYYHLPINNGNQVRMKISKQILRLMTHNSHLHHFVRQQLAISSYYYHPLN